jgi:uncharacterized UBP type Zn finger protein
LLFIDALRSRKEIHRHLSIDIIKEGEDPKATVEKSLAAFFAPSEVELNCEECTYGTHATKELQITSWYVVLVFSIDCIHEVDQL